MSTLTIRGMGKSYGGVAALREADLTVHSGSVHALLGENGAGKSTLIKVVSGAVTPDHGTIHLDDQPLAFSSTAHAAQHGVAVVSQELNLFPDLDVLSNLYPMRELKKGPFRNRPAMLARAEPVLAQLGLDVDPRRLVGDLSLAQQQLVEIAKALITDPRVLILDEPTSALEQASASRLLDILRVLRERDVAVVFVSHILEEVLTLCDEITVLRDGRTVLDGVARADLDLPQIVSAMLGPRETAGNGNGNSDGNGNGVKAADLTPATGPKSTVELTDVEVPGRLHGVTLSARPGEIVGIAGLFGSGHTTVLEVFAGLRRPTAGTVTLPGGKPWQNGLKRAIEAGVALVSGDRKRYGLMLDKPLWENVAQVRTVALGRDGALVHKRLLRQRAADLVSRLHIRTAGVEVRCDLLSGGNQQKVVLAKWLAAQPSALLLDDPTRGVDIGGKAEIHTLLRAAAQTDTVVLLCSTDLEELTELCDRVLVMHRGRLCAELHSPDIDQHTLLRAMNTGSTD